LRIRQRTVESLQQSAGLAPSLSGRSGVSPRLRFMQTLFDHTLKLAKLLFIGSTQYGHLKN
jgi:hypothetical protein